MCVLRAEEPDAILVSCPPPPHSLAAHHVIFIISGEGEDSGQGGHPPRPAAPDLRGQAARGRPHPVRLQHPEGVDAPPGAPPARRQLDYGAVFCAPQISAAMTIGQRLSLVEVWACKQIHRCTFLAREIMRISLYTKGTHMQELRATQQKNSVHFHCLNSVHTMILLPCLAKGRTRLAAATGI